MDGNLTNGRGKGVEGDAENRLVSVTITATGHRSEFGYDGLGRRVQIRELDPDATKTLQVSSDKKYLWDGVDIAEERDSTGSIVNKRFYAQGFVDIDGTILFYTRDHLGSIRELTDNSQAIRARYEYDPYGRMTKVQGDRDSAFTYTGHLWHAQSGLDLTLFRAYDPNLGRWLSRDPLQEAGGVNQYGYVGGSVINSVDTLGLYPGQWPVYPPGYDYYGWKGGRFNDGTPYWQDPHGNKWVSHPEDDNHWRHWDVHDPDGDQKQVLNKVGTRRKYQKKKGKNQCDDDPKGDAPSFDPFLAPSPEGEGAGSSDPNENGNTPPSPIPFLVPFWVRVIIYEF